MVNFMSLCVVLWRDLRDIEIKEDDWYKEASLEGPGKLKSTILGWGRKAQEYKDSTDTGSCSGEGCTV